MSFRACLACTCVILGVIAALDSGARAQTSSFPNDPLLSQQWALNNTGQAGGTPGADIHALQAWGLTHCSRDVIIAMLDTGVDPAQPDLADKLVPGASFVAGAATTSDDNGHGTGTAGVVAAATDNGRGIAGVCALGRIMPVKVADAAGHTDDAQVAAGIRWAVNHGARVINLSLGTADIPQMRDAVAYAYNHAVVVVAATPGGDTYPADYPHVIAVAGSNNRDQAIDQVAHATHDLVLAPDDGVVTTSSGGDFYGPFCTCVSIAAPQVTGVAALLVSLRPDLTVDQIVSAIDHGADPADGQTAFNPIDGYGRVNAYRSLLLAKATMPATPVETPGPTDTPGPSATSVPLSLKLSLKYRTLWGGQKQTLHAVSASGVTVDLRIGYADFRYSYHHGVVGANGRYSYAWRVRKARGRVDVVVTASGGSESVSSMAHFTIR